MTKIKSHAVAVGIRCSSDAGSVGTMRVQHSAAGGANVITLLAGESHVFEIKDNETLHVVPDVVSIPASFYVSNNGSKEDGPNIMLGQSALTPPDQLEIAPGDTSNAIQCATGSGFHTISIVHAKQHNTPSTFDPKHDTTPGVEK